MVLLLAATANLFGLKLHPMDLDGVLHELNVSVEALGAALHLALIQLCLRVPSVMLTPISTGSKRLVAEFAFKWLLTGVHSLMHLEIGLVQELPATGSFLS